MRTAWAWIQVFMGVGIIGVLLWQVGTQSFVDGLRVINLGEIVVALGIGLATTTLSAWRWCLVARRLGLQLSLSRAVTDYYGALFLNAVLPAGVLGDVHRAWQHGRDEQDLGRGVRAVVLERAAGQVAMIVAGVAVLLTVPSIVPAAVQDVVWVVMAVLALLSITFVVGKRSARRDSGWRRTLDDVRLGLLARDAWPGIALLSVAALAGHVTLFLVAAHAAGLTASVGQLVPLIVLSLLAMGLPLNVGGWGPREGVAAWTFSAAGLGAAQGLTTAVVYGVLALVASLPGAGVLLLRAPVLQRWDKRSYATSND